MKNLFQQAAQDEINSRLMLVRPDSQRRWGKMNAHQMICHLADSYRGVMGEKPVSMQTGLFQRTIMKWGGLYFPMPWPQNIPTRPEMDQLQGGTSPTEFQNDVAELKVLKTKFLSSKKLAHPIFGVMTEQEWARWAYLHMDHHLRQFNC